MRTDDHTVRQLVDDLSSAALRDLLRNVRHHTELRRQIASGLIDERMVNHAYREYARREGAAYRQQVADITVQYYSDLVDLGNRYSETFYADVLSSHGASGNGSDGQSGGDGGRFRAHGAGATGSNGASLHGSDAEEVPIELHAPPGKEVMASFALENTESHSAELSIEVGPCQGPTGESFIAPLTVQPAQFVLEPGARRTITLRLVMLPTVFVPGHLYRLRVRIVGPSDLVLLVTVWAEEPETPTGPAPASAARPQQAARASSAREATAKRVVGGKRPAKRVPATRTTPEATPTKRAAAAKQATPTKTAAAKQATAKQATATTAAAQRAPAKQVTKKAAGAKRPTAARTRDTHAP